MCFCNFKQVFTSWVLYLIRFGSSLGEYDSRLFSIKGRHLVFFVKVSCGFDHIHICAVMYKFDNMYKSVQI